MILNVFNYLFIIKVYSLLCTVCTFVATFIPYLKDFVANLCMQQVELTTENSECTFFKILPCYKVKSIGHEVGGKSVLLLCNYICACLFGDT